MTRFGLKSVFSKLFTSVVLTLVFFAIAMVSLMNVVHDNSADARWEALAKQIVTQIDPFVDELDDAITQQELLQVRFMLAVIKKSFDIFDESVQAKMGLYDRNGNMLIQTDESDLPEILPEDPTLLSQVLPAFFSSDKINVKATSDRGYTLLYEPRNPPKKSELWAILNWFTGTLALLALMSVVLWWIARSMTWRINQMSQQMEQLGEGNFSVRVPAKGTDEIGTLARGFNQAAQKIEQLINANSLLLAHASHELRTPITRIRLQVEMMQILAGEMSPETQKQFDKRAQAINRDLNGLNDLVESILLVSRLDAGHAAENNETIDLYELVKQESQHYPEATLYGSSLLIEGQPKLLIHLIRNLLNNALIHGKPPIDIQLYGVVDLNDAPYPLKAVSPAVALNDNINVNDMAHIESSNLLQSQSRPYQSGIADDVSLNTVGINKDKNKDKNKNKDKYIVKNTSATHPNTLTTKATPKRLLKNKPEPNIEPNYAVLSVIDRGKGIPIDKRQEIFTPFVRLQQKNKGSGLGLSLVSQIVEAHHGYIKTDTFHGYTRFIVVLPTNSKSAIPPSDFI